MRSFKETEFGSALAEVVEDDPEPTGTGLLLRKGGTLVVVGFFVSTRR